MLNREEIREQLDTLMDIPPNERSADVVLQINYLLSLLEGNDLETKRTPEGQNSPELTENNTSQEPQTQNGDDFKPLNRQTVEELRLIDMTQFNRDDEFTDDINVTSFASRVFQLPTDLQNLNIIRVAETRNNDSGSEDSGGGGGAGGGGSPGIALDFSSRYIAGSLRGDNNDNTLAASRGNDKLFASAGDDTLNGNEGNDTFVVLASFSAGNAFTINLTTGQASSAVSGTDTLTNIENVTAGDGDDFITGDANANVLRGGDGIDTINGMGGDDIIYGGMGADILTGGAGADRFVYTQDDIIYDTTYIDVDTITDFTPGDGDVIDLSTMFAAHFSSDLYYNYFFENSSDYFRFVDIGGDTMLQIDLDGTYSGEAFTDFLFIQGGAGLDVASLELSGNLILTHEATRADSIYDLNYDVGGGDVAIEGNLYIVSSRGSIWIHDKDNGSKATEIETPISNISFGNIIETANNLLAVGAPGYSSSTGRVYIYDLADNSLKYTLDNPSPNSSDYFGANIDISGDHILIGAYGDDTTGSNDGMAYIYNTSDGSLLYTLQSPDLSHSFFGRHVSLTDDVAIVRSQSSIGGEYHGHINVFDLADGSLSYTISHPDIASEGGFGSISGGFGNTVIANSTYLLVADTDSSVNGNNGSGAAFLYNIADGTYIRSYSNVYINDHNFDDGSDDFGSAMALSGKYSVITQEYGGLRYLPQTLIYDNVTGDLVASIKDYAWSEHGYYVDTSDTELFLMTRYNLYDGEHRIFLTDFNETNAITGTDKRDFLIGLDGDDTLHGGAEADFIMGGTGADQLYGGSGADWFSYDVIALDGMIDTIYDFSVFDGDIIDLYDIPLRYSSTAGSIEDYLQATVSGNDLILSVNTHGTGNNSDYIDFVTIKDAGHFTIHDLLLYGAVNISAPNFGSHLIASPEGKDHNYFGEIAAVYGDHALIYDRSFDVDADTTKSGRAYVYDLATNSVVATFDNILQNGAFLWQPHGGGISSSYYVMSDTYASKVSVYNRADNSLAYTLNNPAPSTADYFGQSLDVNDNYLIVGAHRHDIGGGIAGGSAYIFNIADGSLIHTINNPSGIADQYFSSNVLLTADYAIISAYSDDTIGANSGAVYVYNLSDGSLQYTLMKPAASAQEWFGTAIAVDERYVYSTFLGDYTYEITMHDLTDGSYVRTFSPVDEYEPFAAHIAISQNYLFSGASGGAGGLSRVGSVHIFNKNTSEYVGEIYAPSFSSETEFVVDMETTDTHLVITSANENEEESNRFITIYTLDSNDTDLIHGDAGSDNVLGLGGDDTIYGHDGNDLLYGNAGDDTLYGGNGNDVLFGNEGTDQLYGGAGADTFFLTDANSIDVIHDFNAAEGDKINIFELLDNYIDPLDQAILDFVRISDSGADATVYIDLDGEYNGESFVAVATIVGGAGMDALSMVSDGSLILTPITTETFSYFNA